MSTMPFTGRSSSKTGTGNGRLNLSRKRIRNGKICINRWEILNKFLFVGIFQDDTTWGFVMLNSIQHPHSRHFLDPVMLNSIQYPPVSGPPPVIPPLSRLERSRPDNYRENASCLTIFQDLSAAGG